MPELFFADRVLESSTDVGSGTLSLAGALPGFRSFASAAPGEQNFAYVISGEGADPQWEVGTGRLVAAAGGFAIERSADISSGGGGPCDFAAGQKTIALTASARWFSEAQLPPEPVQAAPPPPPLTHAPVFQNGWGNFAAWAAPGIYYLGADGRVYLSGNVGGCNGGNNVVLFTLPANMRPVASEYFTVRSAGTSDVVGVYVRTNGDVVLQSGAPAWFSLSGISFLAAR